LIIAVCSSRICITNPKLGLPIAVAASATGRLRAAIPWRKAPWWWVFWLDPTPAIRRRGRREHPVERPYPQWFDRTQMSRPFTLTDQADAAVPCWPTPAALPIRAQNIGPMFGDP
jgi:hypothetical protein